jgi:hypothetical protein
LPDRRLRFGAKSAAFSTPSRPLRRGCECRNEYRHYGGGYIIFIGHVERYAYTHKPTLLFCRGKYMRGEPLISD